MPVSGRSITAATLLGALLGGCVTAGGSAQSDANGVDRVAAGEPTFLRQTYMTMDERCRSLKRPTAMLTQPPQHGTVRMATRNAKAVYGPGPQVHCDGKVGTSLAFEYTPRPGYRGPDAFEVRVRYGDGEIRPGRFDVEVR
ncbi:MAG TPA: hypothetical protein VGN82_06820 [Bosea sp. (in: a-proteobacteria)]|jgi:hypothetical protein|uniref:hypothetical protein n=1 Tax=Bosea sp. (in: a-proteobacteria) TaxID=1871050 RepID=UPI002E155DF6|nr:hypothetical protein [Bosea sp. (in: a-proteobacteria)]